MALFLLVLSLLVTGGSFSSTALHPFHVSASEIEYNAKENRLEISSKIFTDDFEKVLERLYKTKADFNNKTLKPQMNGLVTQYITTHLSVRTNGRLLPLKFLAGKWTTRPYIFTQRQPRPISMLKISRWKIPFCMIFLKTN